MGVVKPLFPHKILLLDSFNLASIERLSKTLLVFLAILELPELEDFDNEMCLPFDKVRLPMVCKLQLYIRFLRFFYYSKKINFWINVSLSLSFFRYI